MAKLETKTELGKTGMMVPPVIFGTSALGNLYSALPYEMKLDIVRECFENVAAPVVLDSAGKYGAGLALEMIGKTLRDLGVAPDDVVISNKLAWYRTPLTTPEPLFEPGIWVDLENDAVQKISYDGILECYEQGCELLGGGYTPQVVSVHDPEEYIYAGASRGEEEQAFADVVDAYRALAELRAAGKVKAIGVGSKDWQAIKRIAEAVDLDWVMLACCMTIHNHPQDLLEFIDWLTARGISIINSAVFNAGFLTGGSFFDYREPDPNDAEDKKLFDWRDRFNVLCDNFKVPPAEACVQFGMSPPGVVSIALNTSKPSRVADNVGLVQAEIPGAFWSAMKEEGLIAADYPHLG